MRVERTVAFAPKSQAMIATLHTFWCQKPPAERDETMRAAISQPGKCPVCFAKQQYWLVQDAPREQSVRLQLFNLPPSTKGSRDQSYSLKFESQGRTIVFTGDTGPTAELSAFAKNADVLVSEMASLADRASVPPIVRSHMDMEHLSPLEVGKLAASANVKMLVLSHIGVVSEADLAMIRSVYSGKVILGSDLARLTF